MDDMRKTLVLRPVLAVLASLALALLWAPTATLAQGDTLCVGEGGDYTTIQAAVDAAQDGDTIRIAGGDYTESLVITKTLTLSGGWLADCSAGGDDGTSIAAEFGRVVTIDPVPPGVKVVLADLSLVDGNATGLGGAEPMTNAANEHARAVGTATEAALPTALAAPPITLDRLAAHDPTVAALVRQQFSDRPIWQPAPAWAAQASPVTPAAPAASVDCGGGIYVRGAAIELQSVYVSASIASTTQDGYGGALCVVEPTAQGVLVEDSQFLFNQASVVGTGAGGAVYITGGQPGSVTFRSTLFVQNQASRGGVGWGGGLAILDTPQPTFEGNGDEAPVQFNVASAGSYGYGGGLLFLRTPGAVISNVLFQANTAGGGGVNTDPQSLGAIGRGGALYLEESDQARVEDNQFEFNLAQATANVLASKAEGGAAYVLNSAQVAVRGNTFAHNTGGANGTGHGGGLFIIAGSIMPAAEGVTISGNTFDSNWASAIDYTGSSGGGLFAYRLANSTITTNTFTNNIASIDGSVKPMAVRPYPVQGGGMEIAGFQDVVVAANEFRGNSGVFYGFGMAGGLGALDCVRTVIADNLFEHNLGGATLNSGGLGGALSVTYGDQVLIRRNLFRGNSGQIAAVDDDGQATSVLALVGSDLQAPSQPMIDLTNVAVTENYLLDSGQGVAVGTAPQNFAIQVQATDQFTIANNVIAGSTLGGIVAIYATVPVTEGVRPETHGTIRNNTVANNGKYGLWLLNRWRGETLTAVNNIITGHTYGAEGEDLYGPASPVDLRYTLFYSNTANIGPTTGDSITSTHSFDSDPRFLAPLTHDYHLLPNSPAIDAGDPAGVPPAPAIDIDGAARPYGPRVDAGAVEWQGQGAFLPVFMK